MGRRLGEQLQQGGFAFQSRACVGPAVFQRGLAQLLDQKAGGNLPLLQVKKAQLGMVITLADGLEQPLLHHAGAEGPQPGVGQIAQGEHAPLHLPPAGAQQPAGAKLPKGAAVKAVVTPEP
ncbi:hypothetical protein SDC9_204065 [bioreactor metagenome]|uniref:Uncharacterized protein n=1 Tax=bioreactor metagenome TaxID=1076179 RepID=A0A645IYY5_9ZZZZ